ncbi:putative transposase, partial [Streptococcus pneumoniae GA14798]
DSGFATPKLYDLIEKQGQYYLIKLQEKYCSEPSWRPFPPLPTG